MQQNSIENYGNPKEYDIGISPSYIGVAIAVGFALIVFSTFIDFTPISQSSWRTGGVGLPVMLSCMVGCFLAMRKNYFSAFFIGIFAAFFLTHEIIIIYDNHAIELGQELKPDGWFRSVIMVYQDALRPSYGAFWGFIGAIMASVLPLAGIAVEVWQKNQDAAALHTEEDRDEISTTPDESVEQWVDELSAD